MKVSFCSCFTVTPRIPSKVLQPLVPIHCVHIKVNKDRSELKKDETPMQVPVSRQNSRNRERARASQKLLVPFLVYRHLWWRE